MLRYPIGLQSFRSIREEGYVYVDKTDFIRILLEGSKYYFLARPRRFGKSLFLSTLENFFLGRRDLFRGLAIDAWQSWDWKQYPVIRLDFTGENYSDQKGILRLLNFTLARYERQFGLTETVGEPESPYGSISDLEAGGVASRFRKLIISAAEKFDRKVVILIDEYEKPLLDAIDTEEAIDMNKRLLAAFYSVIKSCDDWIEFAFLTGVTRFGHMNIFSGLNNIQDISLNNRFATICGITQRELESYFHEGIASLAENRGSDYATALADLKYYYDGYHFSRDLLDIYNPFSLLTALEESRLRDVWAQTGNSYYLYNQLKKDDFDLFELEGVVADEDTLVGLKQEYSDPITLLYQAGYLTIKKTGHRENTYVLGLPNHEVKSSLYKTIIPFLTQNAPKLHLKDFERIASWMDRGDIEAFMHWLTEFFSKVTYDVKILPMSDRLRQESDFQFVIFAILSLACGIDRVEVEQTTSSGRIDLSVETERYVYIFEFKLGNDAAKALAQVVDRRYADRWAADPRKVITIGVAFSPDSRRITDYLISHPD